MVTIFLVLAMLLAGQTPTGRVYGRIVDPSGGVLTGVRVVLTGVTGQVVETKTDRQGVYVLNRLAPGDYVITVAVEGFVEVRQPVRVVAGADQAVDIMLAIAIQRHEIVVQGGPPGGATDPAANASAMIIKGKDVDALSDDPNELEAQLRALAGPGAGANAGQIYIDGFTGGRLPPKNAILQVRINQNPYSAEFDTLGAGRIEIVTKPGSQTVHGRFLFDVDGSALNTRNPFLSHKPPHHSAFLGGTLGGPLGSTSSAVVDGELHEARETTAVNAAILDSSLNQVRFNEAVAAPQTLILLNPRVDLQARHNNMLSLRYRFTAETRHGSGVGQLALASQAFDVRKTEHDLQATNLQILSATMLNDARFEYRTLDTAQTARSRAPETTVLGAFTGGGTNLGDSRTSQRHVEVHDYLSASFGAHMIRIGGRLRATAAFEDNRQNFNGTFTFASLNAFQITERGLQLAWTPGQIRAAGGGAVQFAVVAGQPAVSHTMADGGLFAQDDWRLRPNLTISGGLRYETQNGISVRADFAPRIGVAWGLGVAKQGAAPRWVIRSGFGLFYDRFPQTLVLQAERLDGVHTQQFIVASPDFFPAVPSPARLAAARLEPTVYRIDSGLTVPLTGQTGVTVERKLGNGSTVTVGYLYSHGAHQLLSRNLNAAEPRGQVNAAPTYQIESDGTFHQHQLTTNFNLHLRSWLAVNGYYVLNSARGNTSGAGSFPSDPSNLSADYGRAAFDVRHRFSMFASMDLPGCRVVPFITASSGQPFDITVGRDLNGDSVFNDRPAFATDLSRQSVVVNRFGAFDTAPIPGQPIIPRNAGTGPAQVSVNLRVMKPFVVRQHDTIRFDVVVSNLLNHVNATSPVGNLSSPLFGQSIGLSSVLSPSANRRVHAQLQFLF